MTTRILIRLCLFLSAICIPPLFFKIWKYDYSHVIGNEAQIFSKTKTRTWVCWVPIVCPTRRPGKGKDKMKWDKAENWKLLLWRWKGTAKQASSPQRVRGIVTCIPCCLVIQCFQVVLGNYCHLGTFRVVWRVLVVEQPSATPEFWLSLSWHITSFALLWGLSQEWELSRKETKGRNEESPEGFQREDLNIFSWGQCSIQYSTLKKKEEEKKSVCLEKEQQIRVMKSIISAPRPQLCKR